MTPCARPQCPNHGRPTYCSRKCAGIVNAGKRGHAYFVRLGHLGRLGKRALGIAALRSMEHRLMLQGRYQEAARAIYDRAYGAGWIAGKKGHRQLPAKKATAA